MQFDLGRLVLCISEIKDFASGALITSQCVELNILRCWPTLELLADSCGGTLVYIGQYNIFILHQSYGFMLRIQF